jgi:thioredoxin-related protein
LLFFESETCPFCQRMHATVFKHQSLIKAAHASFIPLAIHIDRLDKMHDFAGQAITQQAFSRQLGIAQTPTILFFDSGQQMLHKHTGVIATPREFHKLLKYVRTGAYEAKSWRVYKRKP